MLKVMILGYPATSDREIRHCFHLMWSILHDALKCLPDVEIVHFDCRDKYYPQPSAQPNLQYIGEHLDEFPEADFIIVNELDVFFRTDSLAMLKTKCKRVFSFLELGELCDFSFIFHPLFYRQKEENCKLVPAPYNGRFYKNIKKEKKSLLLDHSAWLGQTDDIIQKRENSHEIYKWIEELKDEFKIYSMVYGSKQGEAALELLPKYVTPIMPCPFLEYLENTNKMETFIVTHKGSYNLSVIDMLVRGIRVISHPDFIPQYNVDRFEIPLYNDKETFLSAVRAPIDKSHWDKQIEKCTSIQALAEVLHEQFTI